MGPMKPGTGVILAAPHDGIPAGTFGIVEWSERGEARVQFLGHIIQYRVPVAALRVVARLHVGVRGVHAPAE